MTTLVTLLSAAGSVAIVEVQEKTATDESASKIALAVAQKRSRGRDWQAVHVLKCDYFWSTGRFAEPHDRPPDPAPEIVNKPPKSKSRVGTIVKKGTVTDWIELHRGRCGSVGDAFREALND